MMLYVGSKHGMPIFTESKTIDQRRIMSIRRLICKPWAQVLRDIAHYSKARLRSEYKLLTGNIPPQH